MMATIFVTAEVIDEMIGHWRPLLDLLGDKTCRDDACPPCSEKRRREREEP